MVSFIKDPAPGVTPGDGAQIKTDMHNEMADRLGLGRPAIDRVVITDGSGFYAVSTITPTKLGYLTDVTSNLQAQINGKAATVHTHVKADITDFAHTHVKADITDFAHTHAAADIVSGQLGAARGGTGIDFSGSSGIIKVTAGVFSAVAALAKAEQHAATLYNDAAMVFTGAFTHNILGGTLDNVAILISNAANPALAGAIRLGNTELINWRNAANTADLGLQVNASNNLLLAAGLGLDANGNTIDNVVGLISNAANVPATGVIRLGNAESIVWRNSINNNNHLFFTDASDDFVWQINAITRMTLSDTALTFVDVKVTTDPNATNAGLNFGSQAGDPSAVADGDVWYNSTTGKFRCRENGVTKDFISASSGASLTRINGASGAAGADFTVQNLTANSADVNTTALSAALMTTTGVGVGTWKFKYTLVYQSAAAGNGIGFGINHTGTATMLQSLWYGISTGGTAATGTFDNDTAIIGGQMAEGKSENVLNTVIGSTSAGVGAANTNVIAILEGILVVTVTGSIELKISSELGGAGNEVRIMADSCLELVKIE